MSTMTPTMIDEAYDVRNGEALNEKRLSDFFCNAILSTNEKLTIKQFPSGYSNLTYLILCGDKEFILRRPPFGKKAKTAHDMSREYRMLTALKSVFPYCPEPILYCDDENIMDSPFYIMQRIKGIILRKDIPEDMHLSYEQSRVLSTNLIKVLCRLHSINYKEIGLENFTHPEGYVARQIEGWSKRYIDARTDDAPTYQKIMQWLHDKIPRHHPKPCIIHNDYKFDNVVLKPDNPLEIIGVLDWEMATVGDPFMDLGSSLAYWVQKDDPSNMELIRTMPTNIDGMLSRKELINIYAETMNLNLDNFDFYYCFGLFRLAVIAQQIYYRYYHGQTKDKRFKNLIFVVKILEDVALKVIERSDL